MSDEGGASQDALPREQVRTRALIDDLRALPAETAWVEFKENNTDPELIGKLISALSNAARLADQHFGYVVWGIRDGDHAVVGTTFDPSAMKHKNQPLDFWLSQCLQPAIAFCFKSIDYEGHRLVLLEIPAAATSPVEFDKTAYVRIGSATPRLSDYPERQKLLWTKIQPYAWETGIAAQFLTGDDSPPRSRNEALASLMRRMRLCEEQGTGIDKVLASAELHQLPPPIFAKKTTRCARHCSLPAALPK